MTENRAEYGAREKRLRCQNCHRALAFVTLAGDIIGIVDVLFRARAGVVSVRCPDCKTWVKVEPKA